MGKKAGVVLFLLLALLLAACAAESPATTASLPPRSPRVCIHELMLSNDAIASPERALCPWIELYAEEDTSLDGWMLQSESGAYRFPEGTSLAGGELLVLWLEGGSPLSLSPQGGETLTLLDETGEVVDSLTTQSAPEGCSLVRAEGGCAVSDAPTPGYENSEDGRLALLEELRQDADAIVISEFMSKNRSTLRDADGDFSDWIELENISDRAVSLSGWQLSDRDTPEGWPLPDVSLAPGERLLVFASGKDRREGELHADFSLSDGETLCLSNARAYVADALTCPESEPDVSFIRESGGFAACAWPTPGHENSRTGYEAWQSSLTAEGPLVINEVMVANFLGTYSAVGSSDWVELRNISDHEVQLSDYYLSDDRNDYSLWQLPKTTLAAGKCLLIACDKDGSWYSPCAPFSLDAGREELYLSDGNHVLDAVSLHDIPLDGSLGRLDGENGFYYFAAPTPGTLNKNGARFVSEMPVSLGADGRFDGVESVTVELAAAGTVYYTTDGSLPTEKSRLYEEPFELSETSIIRAIAVEDGGLPSRALTLSYFINEGHELPVVSLVLDDYNHFRSIYNRGIKGLEMPGSVSLYEADGAFTIGCGVTMSGATSLDLPKKNMSLRFRSAYGSSWLRYDIFGGGVTEFTNLTLRSGQDYYSAIVRNELCQNLALAMSDSVPTQRSRYCALYINGNYWGLYALKEKINRQLYASLAGVSKESVTLLDGPVYGNTAFYQEVCDFVFTHDMSDPDNYAHFCEVMDVDSLIDWLILEGYCANADILRGNVRYVRSTEDDGRWRVVFYDLDATLLRRWNTFYNLLSGERSYIQQISRLIKPLLKNEAFLERFLTRFSAALRGTLSDENVSAELERLTAEIAPELERDFKRWSSSQIRYEFELDYLRRFIADDYAQYNIDTICTLLRLSEEERAFWFGA